MVQDGTSAAHPQTLLFFVSGSTGLAEVSQKGSVQCLTSTENTLGMDQKAWIPCFLHLLLLHRNKMCSRCMWQMDLVVYWLGHLMDGPGKDLFSICGQTSMHEFYINQLLNKLYTWFQWGF